MKLTFHDVAMCRIWAEEHCGKDNPLDVMEHKILSLVAQSHEENAGYHTRQVAECRKLMAGIEERFKVEAEDF